MSRRSSRLSASQPSSPPSSTISTPKALSTNAAAGPSSSSARVNTNDKDEAGSIPYFEEWPTEALQAEVKRYGFKVSRKRTTLIDQLKAVYEALRRSKAVFEVPVEQHEATITTAPAAVKRAKRKLVLPASTPGSDVAVGKGKGKGRQSDPFVVDGDSTDSDSVVLASNAVAGDYTAQLEREALSATSGSNSDSDIPLSTTPSPLKPRPRSRSRSSSPDIPLSHLPPDPEAVEPTAALAETLTSAIRTDPAVWARILRYEPISFDEFVSIATANGLDMDSGKRKEELRGWLDRQCICFYVNDLTGPRSRR
ncbi:conserved hypothetical protein [Sporisorium reilianum SRZ2]|uniref:Structure-specific endonuclease subunit SLX4 n=1 Tax=Sporisorium reilianum (strain SRZ2) TaxID=999809 RepID=E6ZRT1_SPORE|nr:conserved hypothetical protein [Sporisorium reilianum SRZ2]